jgi:hypothetical protein
LACITPRLQSGAEPAVEPTSHAQRVLATLQDLATPALSRLPAFEDGPSRRLRKLAARAAAQVARGEVDVPLPLNSPASPFGDGHVAVAADSLAQVRGGFSGNGLDISFGIERAVYINGALVTSTTMNLVGQGVSVLNGGNSIVINNGAGVANAAISQTASGTVIQNTLDGQKIQNITTINAVANSLGIYRNLNLGASLRGAVIDSLRR